jgi:multiple sugar transport system permease protein
MKTGAQGGSVVDQRSEVVREGGWRLPLRFRHMPFAVGALFPILGVLGVFWFYPIVRGMWGSLTAWQAFQTEAPFIGLDHYVRATTDPVFLVSLQNTFVYAAMTVTAQTLLGLALAVGIDSLLRARGFFRSLYFLPFVTPIIATALVWQFLYQPTFGLFNQLLAVVGLPQQSWLLSLDQALASIAMFSVWKNVGFTMIIFMAALAGIPRHLIEAARVDGASGWQLFRRITLPLMRPALVFVVVIRVILNFQEFGPFFVMTSEGAALPGGPGNSTMVIAVYQWLVAFRELDFGYGSALGIILFLIVVLFTLVLLRVFRTKWEY